MPAFQARRARTADAESASLDLLSPPSSLSRDRDPLSAELLRTLEALSAQTALGRRGGSGRLINLERRARFGRFGFDFA